MWEICNGVFKVPSVKAGHRQSSAWLFLQLADSAQLCSPNPLTRMQITGGSGVTWVFTHLVNMLVIRDP